MKNLIAYYEGDDSVKNWLDKLTGINNIIYKKIPSSNKSDDFINLPSYVSDILYLDKPDVILAGTINGVHEKPILSIEFASCTPQYQHSLQRFSRMMASVVNRCPSVLIIPKCKAENQGLGTIYNRSKAVEYGAVRLNDIFLTPAFIFDWPDTFGILINEPGMQLPLINSESINKFKRLLLDAIDSFSNLDYISALKSKPIIRQLTDELRTSAYENGTPTPAAPGGGRRSNAKLDVVKTTTLLRDIQSSIPGLSKSLKSLPEYFMSREECLVFYPSRITSHAGDPYVGMVGYYDIAFCRSGITPRERDKNLVAYAKNVSVSEVTDSMKNYNDISCPFNSDLSHKNVNLYGYHLKNGCKFTKSKPIRIYSELTDLIIFNDGCLF
jgi:hypothetical protein